MKINTGCEFPRCDPYLQELGNTYIRNYYTDGTMNSRANTYSITQIDNARGGSHSTMNLFLMDLTADPIAGKL